MNRVNDPPSGIDLHDAHTTGSGSRTVVFGHGFGTDQTCWQHQVDAVVAQGFRAVTFDFAGATERSRAAFQPGRHRSLYGFAEDLVALMAALQIRGATYVGHSLGGTVGAIACNGDPGVFDSLVMLGSSARYLDEPATGYVGGFSQQNIDLFLATMQHDFAAWANGFAQFVLGEADRPLFAPDFSRRILTLRPDIAVATLQAAFLSDHRHDIAQLRVPVQVLQTAVDGAVPLEAAQWLATHSRARDFTVIPTEGHLPHITAPDSVSAALLNFLATHVGK